MSRARGRRFAALLSLVLGAVAPAAALGHGGQFRGPPGGIPPGLRPPSDPQPPPPPPPTGQPPTETPPDTGSPPPGTGSPTNPPPTPPPTTGDPIGDRPRGAKPAVTQESWVYWWAHNEAEILRLKEEIYRWRGSEDTPLGSIGGAKGNVSGMTRPTERENRALVVPALLRVIDGARRPGATHVPDTESSAYLALAKVTEEPEHARRFAEAAAATGSDGASQIVRESAALALGLLRRSNPARRFDAKTYDRARDDAFALFADDALATRTRAFAALAIGLLGDMPTTRGPAPTDGPAPAEAAGVSPDAASRLFALLREKYANPDLPIALLAALALQPPPSVTAEMQDVLEDAVLRGRLFKASTHPYVSAWAAHALGRVGGPSRARPLLLAVSSRSLPAEVRRSAAIAVGRVALRVDGEERAALADGLARAVDGARDGLTRSFGTMSLSRLLAADADTQRHDVLGARDGKVAAGLVALAERGSHALRPYGALALGIVLRSLGAHPDEAWTAWAVPAREALRAGLSDKGLDARSRGAFAVGLGLAREEGAAKDLLALLGDRREDHELRGYCAVGLGLLGLRSSEAVAVVRRALSERSSEELRLQCATALGLLGVRETVDLLLAELRETEVVALQGPIVIALARVGDARALPPLLALLEDVSRPDGARAMACAGLGLVGDLEPVPTFTRISSDVNYAATSEALREFLTLL